MFIKVAKKIKGGKSYEQYQLKESYRSPAGPRNRVVLNLGVGLNLTPEERKSLADAIEMKLCNQQSLFPISGKISDMAEKYARLIQAKKLTEEATTEQEEATTPDYETVDVNSLQTVDNRSIGLEHIVNEQMKEYKFDSILRELEFSEKDIAYAKISISSKICHPGSERETTRWALEDSAISEVIDTDVKIYDQALHRIASKLLSHQDKIEDKLAFAAKEAFNLEENIILYDLTNTFFESSKKDSNYAKHGKSKEKRTDCPLLTVALTIDDDGFPKRSQMLQGNIGEASTLKKALNQIVEYSSPQSKLYKKTLVMDAGIASEENIALLKTEGFSYIVVSRKSKYKSDFWSDSKEEKLTLKNGKDTLTMRVARENDELFLLCTSSAKEAKGKAILQQRMKRFEEELQKIKEGLKKPNTRKDYEKIIERIGKAKQQYKVASLYDIKVSKEESEKEKTDFKATELIFSRNSTSVTKLEKAGDYVLRTDRTELNNESISKIHRSLTTIENCFESMKSDLGLRPNHHQTDKNSIAHMFIVVLALHFATAILKKLQVAKIKDNITTLRNSLSTHRRVTTIFNTENKGAVLEIRNTGTPNARQQEIYRSLKIKQKPLKVIKRRVVLGSKEVH